MIIIGDKEVESGTVSVRSRKEGELGAISCGDLLEKLNLEISSKAK